MARSLEDARIRLRLNPFERLIGEGAARAGAGRERQSVLRTGAGGRLP
ncbi:hypothetical protein Snoj_42750 [Streptomyces nojiriensis]|uniref:Uncharacterized protein n=2 Tax=Streptomyces nojiriensis TaxID=66374 RepID=A0ABQ3SQM7_9ACTN|nr:hypothetical protein GCM10010205_11410 [Streptomyces nojiriensis]GHI70357.1 hypothetical protein Snoj_42750 [Streptomyces nojiriensis]